MLVSAGVYLYTRSEEWQKFTTTFEDDALQVLESFHDMVERNLGAVGSLSTDFTSYALQSNSSFSFVTLPDFALRGSHFRSLSGSHIVHWLPLVTDENREAWEEYALEHRSHIDEQFFIDGESRAKQDMELSGHSTTTRSLESEEGDFMHEERILEDESDVFKRNMTVLGDGTGFHPKLWSNGAVVPAGDEPEGSGPYLPTWQRR